MRRRSENTRPVVFSALFMIVRIESVKEFALCYMSNAI